MGKTGKSILIKAGQMVVALFVLSIIVFYMSRLSPGDPLRSYYGDSVERMSAAQQENARERLGLSEPIHQQYAVWLSDAAKGEFGISYKYKKPVLDVVGDVWFNTLLLGGCAYLLTFLFALLIGIFCARREGRISDRMICKAGTILNSIPSFWVALILILIFSVNLKLLPASGAYGLGESGSAASRAVHLVLPLAVLVLSHLWYYAYMVRNKLLEEVRKDYVLFCRVKGMGEKQILYRHCLRNIASAYINIMAVSVPHILAGTYVVEMVFSYPGLGTLCFESAKYHDYNMLMVLCLLTGVVVMAVSLGAQVVSSQVDPQLRHERGREAG